MFWALFIHAQDAQEIRDDPEKQQDVWNDLRDLRQLFRATPWERGQTGLLAERLGARAMLRERLEQEGFRVITASDEQAAVAILRGIAVDALVRVGSPAFRVRSDAAMGAIAAPLVEGEDDPAGSARLADAIRARLLCIDTFGVAPRDRA